MNIYGQLLKINKVIALCYQINYAMPHLSCKFSLDGQEPILESGLVPTLLAHE